MSFLENNKIFHVFSGDKVKDLNSPPPLPQGMRHTVCGIRYVLDDVSELEGPGLPIRKGQRPITTIFLSVSSFDIMTRSFKVNTQRTR